MEAKGSLPCKMWPKAVFLNRRAVAPVPGPGINYTRPREVLLEIVILVF